MQKETPNFGRWTNLANLATEEEVNDQVDVCIRSLSRRDLEILASKTMVGICYLIGLDTTSKKARDWLIEMLNDNERDIMLLTTIYLAKKLGKI